MRGVERVLQQDFLNARIQPRVIRGREIESRYNDYRNVSPRRLRLQRRNELKSIHLRHHEIEEDNIRSFFRQLIERNKAVLGFAGQPVLGLQPRTNPFALHQIVFDHKDARTPGASLIWP